MSHRLPLRAPDGRLRAWLRILIVVALMLVIESVVSAVALLFDRIAVQFAVSGITVGLVMVGMFVIVVRRLDRRRPRSYGLSFGRGWWSDLAAGAAIGIVAPAAAFLALVTVGWIEVAELLSAGSGEALWTGLLAAAVVYVAVGVWEELIFRGYVIGNLAESLRARRGPRRAAGLAIAISAVIFAAGHPAIVTADAPFVISAAMFLSIGVVLACAYVFTGQLALPIGLHVTLNLTANRILPLAGTEGLDQVAVVARPTVDAPAWVVGDGGGALLLTTILAGLAVWGWLLVRHRPVRMVTDLAPEPRHDRGDRSDAPPEPEPAGSTAVRVHDHQHGGDRR